MKNKFPKSQCHFVDKVVVKFQENLYTRQQTIRAQKIFMNKYFLIRPIKDRFMEAESHGNKVQYHQIFWINKMKC